MVVSPSDQPEQDDPSWNAEGDRLAFIRDEGLDLLALFQKIEDRKKRQLVLDIMRMMVGESR